MEDRSEEIFDKSIKKKFENCKLGTAEALPKLKPNYTGSLRLDIDLVSPCSEGKIVEIFGNGGAGKTTLSLSILSEAVKVGKPVAFQDQERSLNKGLVDTFPSLSQSLKVMQAEDGTEALQMVEAYVKHFPSSVIVVDSVDALMPKAIMENQVGDATVGSLARLMSDGCRRLKDACSASGATVIFLNQIRMKVGGYGNPETTSGGKALEFYAHQRIHLLDNNKTNQLKDEAGKVIGHTLRYYITKNKAAPPFISGQVNLVYGKGFDVIQEAMDLGLLIGVLQADGKYILDSEGKKRPPKTFHDQLESDPKLFENLLTQIKSEYPETWPLKVV